MNNISDMPTLKEKFVKRFFSWGQTLQEKWEYWENKKFDHNKYDMEQFAYGLKVMGKMIGMSDEQNIEQRNLPTKNWGSIVKLDYTDEALVRWELWYCCSNPNYYSLQVYLY